MTPTRRALVVTLMGSHCCLESEANSTHTSHSSLESLRWSGPHWHLFAAEARRPRHLVHRHLQLRGGQFLVPVCDALPHNFIAIPRRLVIHRCYLQGEVCHQKNAIFLYVPVVTALVLPGSVWQPPARKVSNGLKVWAIAPHRPAASRLRGMLGCTRSSHDREASSHAPCRSRSSSPPAPPSRFSRTLPAVTPKPLV
jgi:hypothetical protein